MTVANKYSYYQLSVACNQKMIASLYTEPDDPDAFIAGYVEAVTQRHVLMWTVTPWGEPDGWILRRTADVIQVFMGDDYEIRLQMLLQMYGHAHTPLLGEDSNTDEELLNRVLQYARENNEVISIMTQEDTFTGRVIHLDDLRVTLDVFDFFGEIEVRSQFTLREIELVAIGTNEELMYKRLNGEQL